MEKKRKEKKRNETKRKEKRRSMRIEEASLTREFNPSPIRSNRFSPVFFVSSVSANVAATLGRGQVHGAKLEKG